MGLKIGDGDKRGQNDLEQGGTIIFFILDDFHVCLLLQLFGYLWQPSGKQTLET